MNQFHDRLGRFARGGYSAALSGGVNVPRRGKKRGRKSRRWKAPWKKRWTSNTRTYFRASPTARLLLGAGKIAFTRRKEVAMDTMNAGSHIQHHRKLEAIIQQMQVRRTIDDAKEKIEKSQKPVAKPTAKKKTKEFQLPGSLMVFKEVGEKDDYRWVMFTSNGYRDRDGEIISTKALEHDVAMWELAGKPQDPLRYWHLAVNEDQSIGLDLGHVDFRMVQDHTLIESGKFLTKEIGEKVFENQADYSASIGYRHPLDEPDYDKIFNVIRSFERSILPTESASNLLTDLLVV